MDEKESGERRCLNVGHTTGHAIELSSGLSHGESVLYGMLLETRMAMENGVCEKSYGESLLSIVERAIAVAPNTVVDFSTIGKDAEKARADKKNLDDGKIKMAVAKAKGEWTMFSLDFAQYREELIKAAR
jgi:3-dehydroquinate synthetase